MIADSPALRVVVLVTALGGAVGLLLAGLAWRHRDHPAAVPFGWLSVAMTGWTSLSAALLLVRDPGAARSVYQLQTVPMASIPPLWFVFVIAYTGHRDRLTPLRLAAIWAVPAVYAVGISTAPAHGFVDLSVTFATVGDATAPIVKAGPIGWPMLAVSYLYALVGFGLLVRFYLRSRNVYRTQTAVVVAGMLVPFVGNALYTAGFELHPAVDPTPALYVLGSVFVGLALFRYEFLSVSPIAERVLVEELPDPVLVLDGTGSVIDHNPAAAGLVSDRIRGKRLTEVAPALDRSRDVNAVTVELADGTNRRYDPRITPIEDQYGERRGELVLLRDVTAKQEQLDRIAALQDATRRQIEARTRTGVAEIAVDFASDVLDLPYAALFDYDASTDTLDSVAATDSFDAFVDWEQIRLPRDDGPVWEAFETGETRSVDHGERFVDAGETLPVSGLVLPLGEHGIMGIGVGTDREFSETERQIAVILARTVETALTRVEHEQELRRSRRAIAQRNEQIAFFNGVLRHNIRNGMTVIHGHAEHLRDRARGEHAELRRIERRCRDLTELTEKVQTINETVTRPEGERLETVDLSTALAATVDRIEREYQRLALQVDAQGGHPVEANELLVDVLESVLRNAVEHNDTETPTVHVETRPVGDRVQVRITDDGPGLSDEMKERVFERDIGTDQTAQGFGLYFVSVMMDVYDGAVWFEDNDPRGTVAVLEFRQSDGDSDLSDRLVTRWRGRIQGSRDG